MLAEPTAIANTSYRATFKVGHGCDGSGTTGISITLPPGVTAAKPMPKAGWKIEITSARLQQPYDSHGKTITEDVREISWRGGPLPDSQYDEFVVQLHLPDRVGKLYFVTLQSCERGRFEWKQIPEAGKSRRDYPAPAPELELLPAPGIAPAVAPPDVHRH